MKSEMNEMKSEIKLLNENIKVLLDKFKNQWFIYPINI
jgi:hypothetical protein